MLITDVNVTLCGPECGNRRAVATTKVNDLDPEYVVKIYVVDMGGVLYVVLPVLPSSHDVVAALICQNEDLLKLVQRTVLAAYGEAKTARESAREKTLRGSCIP